jgi:hypothetical protein
MNLNPLAQKINVGGNLCNHVRDNIYNVVIVKVWHDIHFQMRTKVSSQINQVLLRVYYEPKLTS